MREIYRMTDPTRKLILLTAPSGSGKTSITRYLIGKYPKLSFSISATTRQARGTEKNGVEYYFMSVPEFRQKISDQAFVEWEMVYDEKYYGTLHSELDRIWSEGKIPMLDIDVKGAIHVQEQYAGNCLSLFIQPPSVEELRKRLENRGSETPESLAARINKASYELSFSHHFHKTILNDNLERACAETEQIIKDFLGW